MFKEKTARPYDESKNLRDLRLKKNCEALFVNINSEHSS